MGGSSCSAADGDRRVWRWRKERGAGLKVDADSCRCDGSFYHSGYPREVIWILGQTRTVGSSPLPVSSRWVFFVVFFNSLCFCICFQESEPDGGVGDESGG